MRRILVVLAALPASLLVQGFAVPTPPPNFLRFKRLQNQFDIRGVALPPANDKGNQDAVTLSPVEAYFLGQAFATWLRLQQDDDDDQGLTVAVGRDSRLTGPALSRAVLDGVEAVRPGAAIDLGLCSTPAAFHACLPPPLGLSARGSVEVTASHLPPDRNGLKLFARHGPNANDPTGLGEDEVDDLIVLATKLYNDQRGAYPNLDLPTTRPHPTWTARHDFLPDVYGAYLASLIRAGGERPQPLKGMRIVVNPGHGAGGFFLSVLAGCGADTSGSFNVNPDGSFPGGNPNPEDGGNMQATVAAVAAEGADLGIIFDPDCDRLGLVEGSGQSGGQPTPLNRNRLIAMAAAVVLREHPGTTIVTDSVTSEGLRRFIERRGGRHLRFKKGYRNVIAEAQALNARGVDCQLAMECSGHAAFKENRFLDDGAYLAVKLLGELAAQRAKGAGCLSDLIKDLEEPVEYAEIRLAVLPGHDRAAATERVLKAFGWVASVNSLWQMEKENWEGLRARVQEGGGRTGWLHFRPSLHDPVVSLTCESETPGGIAAMVRTLLAGGVEEATADAGVDWAEAHRYLERIQGKGA